MLFGKLELMITCVFNYCCILNGIFFFFSITASLLKDLVFSKEKTKHLVHRLEFMGFVQEQNLNFEVSYIFCFKQIHDRQTAKQTLIREEQFTVNAVVQ